MTDTTNAPGANAAAPFDLDAFELEDVAEMAVVHPHTGEPSTWKIRWAGPTHPKTLAHRNKVMRQGFKEMRKPRRHVEEDPDPGGKMTAEIVETLVARCLGWTEATHKGQPIVHSDAAARGLFHSNPILRSQSLAFLNEDANFLRRSAGP